MCFRFRLICNSYLRLFVIFRDGMHTQGTREGEIDISESKVIGNTLQIVSPPLYLKHKKMGHIVMALPPRIVHIRHKDRS